MFGIPKISVLDSISVYQYGLFNNTDIPKFPIYRDFWDIETSIRQNHRFCFTTLQKRNFETPSKYLRIIITLGRHFILDTSVFTFHNWTSLLFTSRIFHSNFKAIKAGIPLISKHRYRRSLIPNIPTSNHKLPTDLLYDSLLNRSCY